jgi:peroxiredoxin
MVGMASRPRLVGGRAPEIHLKTLEGNSVRLIDYQEKVVLLTFWATWCEPCLKEFVEIIKAYDVLKAESFMVLAVNVGERPELVRSFARSQNIPFPIVLDRKAKAASRYQVSALPVSFFIDPNGIIQERVLGELLTVESIRAIHRQILEKLE